MAAERLSRAAVADRALRLGDEEGLEAVTIRRLAQELGVTPMALYWHFKNKDELLRGIADHALAGVRSDPMAAGTWQEQVRAMVEALVGVLRAHPFLADVLHHAHIEESGNYTRAAEDGLALLHSAGFTLQEGFWILTYLMRGAIGLEAAQPDCPVTVPADEAPEWRRQKRLSMERLPVDIYPNMVSYAVVLTEDLDRDAYYRFGIDMLMAGVETMAARRAAVR